MQYGWSVTTTSDALPRTIMVVDDEREIRESLSQVLEDAGYAVVCAEHGAQALAKLAQIPPPSAILLDLFMPELSGWRFAEQLKLKVELAPIPLIVITAAGTYWGTPVPKERVLYKPFKPEQLLELLNASIGSP
jgi:CheY-like chemotaxis protein